MDEQSLDQMLCFWDEINPEPQDVEADDEE